MTRQKIGRLPLGVRRAPGWVDAVLGALAGLLAVTVLLSADLGSIDPGLHAASPIAVVVTAVGAAGIGLRRRLPLLGLALVAVAAVVVSGRSQFTGLLPYLTMVALYSVAANGTRREAVGGLVLVVLSFIALHGAGVPDLAVVDVVTSAAVCVAAVAVGDAVRQRRAHQQDLVAAAESRAEVAAQGAVVEERLRIARELHDVVAHSMSLIAVQAGVGAHLLYRDPGAAERALEVIADTSRYALSQTRSVFGLLRGDDAQPSLPGLVSLAAMVDAVRQAGMVVDVRVEGTRREVPATVDLAAYRVIQEALTNALKHAPDRPVTVGITYAPAALRVDVGDAAGGGGAVEAKPADGFGLIGLRERTRAVGGTLTAGPTAGGGFRVVADLPTGGAAA
jgi:signal transduction histidine kinase